MALYLPQRVLPSRVLRPISRRFVSGAAPPAPSPVAMAAPLKVAAVQMTSVNDLSANFSVCSQLVKEAATVGVKLLCFPENFSFVGARDGESLAVAQSLDGPIMQGSSIFGYLSEAFRRKDEMINICVTHVLIDESGNIRNTYRKIHLFDVDVPGGMVYKEGNFTTADRLETGLAIAEIDLSLVDAVRKKMPLSEHRRPEIYRNASCM